MSKRKTVPVFRQEADERAFWETHDTVDYLDWQQAAPAVFPNLKKTTKTISIRLPEDLLHAIKARANALDVPYQSLMKMALYEAFMKETSHDRTDG